MQILSAAREMIEDFIESTNQFKNTVHVKYYLKRRNYGFKFQLDVRNAKSDSTVMNVFLKVRSLHQVNILQCTLHSVLKSIEHYVDDITGEASDTDLDTIVID